MPREINKYSFDKILISVENVIADLFLKCNNELELNPDQDKTALHDMFGMDYDKWLDFIKLKDESFWQQIKKYDHADMIVDFCCNKKDTYFYSKPVYSEFHGKGIYLFVKEHFHGFQSKLIVTPNVDSIAGVRTLIITDDQKDYNFIKTKTNASAILFPRAWNTKREEPLVKFMNDLYDLVTLS